MNFKITSKLFLTFIFSLLSINGCDQNFNINNNAVNNSPEISSFEIENHESSVVINNIDAVITTYVPSDTSNLSALKPVIIHNGFYVSYNGIHKNGETFYDFSASKENPLTFTVHNTDNTYREYKITVTRGSYVPTKPYVDKLHFSGDFFPNYTVKINYNYFDINADVEDGTSYTWFIADDNLGNGILEINNSHDNYLTLKSNDAGKYLKCIVTPKNKADLENTGLPTNSDWYKIYNSGDNLINNFSFDRDIQNWNILSNCGYQIINNNISNDNYVSIFNIPFKNDSYYDILSSDYLSINEFSSLTNLSFRISSDNPNYFASRIYAKIYYFDNDGIELGDYYSYRTIGQDWFTNPLTWYDFEILNWNKILPEGTRKIKFALRTRPAGINSKISIDDIILNVRPPLNPTIPFPMKDIPIENYSFEKLLVGWSKTSPGELLINTDRVHSEQYSAHWKTITSTPVGRTLLSNPIQIDRRKELRISIACFTDSPVQNTAVSIKLYYFKDHECLIPSDIASYSTQNSSSLQNIGLWNIITYTRLPGQIPADVKFYRIELRANYISGTGSPNDKIYFDTIKAVQL